MNQISNLRHAIVITIALCFSVLSPIQAANPVPKLYIEGQILSIDRHGMNIDDMYFKVIPTVKVSIKGKSRARFYDLKVGDVVSVEIIRYDDKYFIDKIFLPPKRAN